VSHLVPATAITPSQTVKDINCLILFVATMAWNDMLLSGRFKTIV